MFFMLLLAIAMNFGSWFYSDTMVIKATGASPRWLFRGPVSSQPTVEPQS